uniref:Putative secreted protein n=1 Tax=Anopheles marajoara TaxID=58244 RepID=A0A2M4C8A9_9DIPT
MHCPSVVPLFFASGVLLNCAFQFPLLKYEAHEILAVAILLSEHASAFDQYMRVKSEFEKTQCCRGIQSLILSFEKHSRVHYFPLHHFSPAPYQLSVKNQLKIDSLGLA